jgi:hypothetical protein
MRKILFAGLLALSLPGCATNLDIPQVNNDTVAQVQKLTTDLCGFLPVATTVLEIVSTFTSAGATVSTIAQAAKGICAAVTSRGARRGQVVKFRGVTIRGQFVRG